MPRMRCHWRRGVFATVALLASFNALALYGDAAARWVAVALQAGVGVSAMVCAVVVTRRVTGVARWWRILVIAAMASWVVGELIWYLSGAAARQAPAPAVGVAAHFLPPVLSLTAMILLARAGGGVRGEQAGAGRYARVLVVLDGLVAGSAFSLLVLLAGAGAMTGAALPHSQDRAVVVAYSLLELGVVVLAALMAMAYRRGRPYRQNYLLLSCGVMLIVGSDRLGAYLHHIGAAEAQLWGGLGAILGPLVILFAVAERGPQPESGARQDVLDWVQLALPYIVFVGVVLLCTAHVLTGHRLPRNVALAGMAMLLFVTARQAVAMQVQWLLRRRLYAAHERLAHQVHHDSLTGLPNRLLFAERLDAAIRDGGFVLIFVDLDDFKDVNDQFGHAAGDELLRAVGDRLRRHLGEADTLARIGGDEFAILIDGEAEAPEVVADRLRVALRDPFAVEGTSVRVKASMGLVRPRTEGPSLTSDELLRQADSSMYAGKRLGKDTAVVYRPSSGMAADFPAVLRQADGGVPHGFEMAYQPIVRIADGTPVAVEALARWTAPNGTQIPPQTFVAAAESAGLGAVLDALVLDVACREVAASGSNLTLHVNVGANRLGNLALEQTVRDTLARSGLEPERLVVEITETVPVVDLAEAATEIRRLNALGVSLALDDFGAGYNSLTYLHALPVQIIKLDRGLATGTDPQRDVTLYRSVISLCDALGFSVIAEGIESRAQADTVASAGCRLAQGHLFGRAMPISEVNGYSVRRADPVVPS